MEILIRHYGHFKLAALAVTSSCSLKMPTILRPVDILSVFVLESAAAKFVAHILLHFNNG